MHVFTDADQLTLHRRTLRTLMVAVLPAGAAYAGAFAATALLGLELSGSPALGTLAASFTTIGGALATVPLASYMAAHGRRRGLRAAWSIAAAGAALAAAAALTGLYPLLLVGALCLGVTSTANLAARFAAADLAPDEGRARAIGALVWVGSVGAVLGPSLALGVVGTAAESLGLPGLSGPYLLALLLLLAAAAIIHRRLRPDPLEVLGTLTVVDPSATAVRPLAAVAAQVRAAGGPLRRIAASRPGRLAVGGMLVGHAVMVGVMTATPLHMGAGAHELQVIGLVISVHVLGMYALAPVVGWLTDRVGARSMIVAGGLLLLLGAELASHTRAVDSQGVFVGLFLIGVGWSCGLIAGSSLLSASFPPAERVPIQGAADLLMSGAGAMASLLAGVVYQVGGYDTLSHGAGIAAGALAVAAAAGIRRRPRPPVSAH